MKIGIIGGGAAGFFTAINIASTHPSAKVTIYEGSNKLLSKVLISGGGRCNVCNGETDPEQLAKGYPRGSDLLLTQFRSFGTAETINWFRKRGIELKKEADGRMFPVSNRSETIVQCFLDQAKRYGIRIETGMRLTGLTQLDSGWNLQFNEREIVADKVVFCTGGSNGIWQMLEKIGLPIIPPVPSLFTFNIHKSELTSLSGVSVPEAGVWIKGQKNVFKGPLLITHKGLSGPAILRMSAWEARSLAELGYTMKIVVSWAPPENKALLENMISRNFNETPKEKVWNWKEHGLPRRLYQMLLEELPYREYTNWSELGKKGAKAILQKIFEYELEVKGKNTFKEEFVTAGGVDLNALDWQTMESKKFKNLYFAGEVINVDGITGGYNFQAAWTTSWHVAHSF